MLQSLQGTWFAVQDLARGTTSFRARKLSDSYTSRLSDLILSMLVTFWAPHTTKASKDINSLESVQKFACKMISCRWNGATYEELLTIYSQPAST